MDRNKKLSMSLFEEAGVYWDTRYPNQERKANSGFIIYKSHPNQDNIEKYTLITTTISFEIIYMFNSGIRTPLFITAPPAKNQDPVRN